ncbi:hypothetical protein [Bacillus massiliigorillae]|uniref:hypothetical protein n=1 Tax=Bacillus massiliigorillae TaxID=1243664 RepID=UPI00039EFDBB|nr:hypothetical protein [Bacillus massiliigorillae]
MYYRIGSIDQVKEGEHKVNLIREFTQQEYDTHLEKARYLGVHLKNKHLYQLIVKNGEELEKYLEIIRDKEMSELESPDSLIFESNRLFMNYLSILRTYDDHISSALSKTFNSQVKEEFKSFLSKMYDQFYTYRFIVRLRNFAQHFDLPISSFTNSQNGKFFVMNREQLLRYDGWSTVKQEIQRMEENIAIQGLTDRMNRIMHNVYLYVMQLYAGEIIDACKWISSLQKEFFGKATIIATANSYEEYKSGEINFIPMNSQMYIDAIHDLNELPNVNININ